jgi:hypothetical protein
MAPTPTHDEEYRSFEEYKRKFFSVREKGKNPRCVDDPSVIGADLAHKSLTKIKLSLDGKEDQPEEATSMP